MELCLRLNYRIVILLLIFKSVVLHSETESVLTKFKKSKSWLYQLQNINFNKIKDSYYDILVTDYSWDGSEQKEYRAGQIYKLKRLTGKIVLSYLSIGEAEDYRFYWKDSWGPGNPDFIVKENPQWKGNYKVKYWDKRWQNIIFEYIDRIISMGFDGLYLDIIDAYQYFEKEKKDAKEQMINFVLRIADYCRNKKGKKHYIIIPQNAPELVENKKYLDTISGIAQEETYFRAMDIPSGDTEYNEKYLDIVIKNGKKVLIVDYCMKPENIEFVYKKAVERGYIPYCTVVELDRVVDNKMFFDKYFKSR